VSADLARLERVLQIGQQGDAPAGVGGQPAPEAAGLKPDQDPAAVALLHAQQQRVVALALLPGRQIAPGAHDAADRRAQHLHLARSHAHRDLPGRGLEKTRLLHLGHGDDFAVARRQRQIRIGWPTARRIAEDPGNGCQPGQTRAGQRQPGGCALAPPANQAGQGQRRQQAQQAAALLQGGDGVIAGFSGCARLTYCSHW